tara:strand:- start:415 stop:831 length:417 start_codon:yes stop_codon:yes gene_type:complete
MEKFLNHYSVGLHNVGSYQTSGRPWLTGSEIGDGAEQAHHFPTVTKAFTVTTSGSMNAADAAIRIHFVSTGSNTELISTHNYITLEPDSSITLNVKCKEVYLSSIGDNAYELFADLTNIPTASMFTLTGSGIAGPGLM